MLIPSIQREVFVGNLTEELVTCPEDIAHWLAKGEGMSLSGTE